MAVSGKNAKRQHTSPSAKRPRGPTRAELLAAADRTVEDVIAKGLQVLFCGINPGLYTAWTGHHFARPGNRFWPALYAGGFTPRLFAPSEERGLLPLGYGITNIVSRTTATAAELSEEEVIAGGEQLVRVVHEYQPHMLAVLGVTPYRVAFEEPEAKIGLQTRTIGDTRVWLLPNPSGLNAHYQAETLAKLFSALRSAAKAM